MPVSPKTASARLDALNSTGKVNDLETIQPEKRPTMPILIRRLEVWLLNKTNDNQRPCDRRTEISDRGPVHFRLSGGIPFRVLYSMPALMRCYADRCDGRRTVCGNQTGAVLWNAGHSDRSDFQRHVRRAHHGYLNNREYAVPPHFRSVRKRSDPLIPGVGGTHLAGGEKTGGQLR